MVFSLLAVFLFLQAAVADHHLQEQALSDKYQFSHQLHDRYTLYWTYDPAAEEVSFAVFVQTTGWIGFGLSPTGQMPGSDVVIGWVDDGGRSYFNDRFASLRATPAIDEQQNWFLVNAMEDDGYTTLEFKRDYISCDTDYDLNIEPNTARVVWSFKEEDPPNGAEGTFVAHDFKGSASLNLLGGLLDSPHVPDDTEYFEILADNVAIPSEETTYWCSSFILPEVVQNQEKYIIRVSPNVTGAHVHHLVVYLCADVTNPNPAGTQCDQAPDDVNACLTGTIIAAWAIGGEDFVYPENVAFPIGGANGYAYAVMQLHYDNPRAISGVVDNSGMRFYYSNTAREYNAGIMHIGHRVVLDMMIPPHVSNYTVVGLCPTECTQYFPDEGIKIFANLFHTHLIGVGMELLHLREQENCNGVRELEPIDQNLQYDSNFQNMVHLDEKSVQQGDILLLRCIYNSTSRVNVTLGGESIMDEMCFSFIVYYPAVGITDCTTRYLDGEPLIEFVENYIPVEDRAAFFSLIDGYDREELYSLFNPLKWTSVQLKAFQELALSSVRKVYCRFTKEYAIEIGANHQHGPYNTIQKDPVNITCNYEEQEGKDCSAGAMGVTGFIGTLSLMLVVAVAALYM